MNVAETLHVGSEPLSDFQTRGVHGCVHFDVRAHGGDSGCDAAEDEALSPGIEVIFVLGKL